MVRGAFIAHGACRNYQRGNGQAGLDPASHGEAKDHSRPRREKLFRNQNRVRTADRTRDHAAWGAIRFQLKHGCVKASPRQARSDELLLEQPVGQVTIKLEHTDGGNTIRLESTLLTHGGN